MVVVSHLAVASRVVSIGFFAWHLFEHGIEQKIQPSVPLDRLLELLDHRVEVFGIVGNVLDNVFKPFLLDAVVGWEPSTGPGKL